MSKSLSALVRGWVLIAVCASLIACVPMPSTVVVVVTATPEAQQADEPPPTKRPVAEPAAPKSEDAAPTKAPAAATEKEGAEAAPPAMSMTGDGVMCAGTFGFGITCLDAAGWRTYDKDNTPALRSDQVKDALFCGDGKLYVTVSSALVMYDGASWSQVDTDDWGGTPDTLACGANGGLWAGHYKGLTFYDGAKATTYKERDFSEEADSPKDVAVAPDGRLWLITNNEVAVYDGKEWTVYAEGTGFDTEHYFDVIAVDGKGQPFVGGSEGVFTLNGDTWSLDDTNTLFQTKSMVTDNEGRIWAGTYSDGVNLYTGSGWTNYNRENSGLSSDHVRSLAVDAQGRIWLGTEWGLNIFDGKNWTTYWMHNSELADNEIYALAISGNGPALPAPVTKGTGSLAGRVISDSLPIADSIVEACVEYLGFMFSGPTPCSDQPMSRSTKTDADGKFTITDLQPGRYTLTFEGPDKRWMRLTSSFGIGSRRYTVKEGETTDLKDINIAKKE